MWYFMSAAWIRYINKVLGIFSSAVISCETNGFIIIKLIALNITNNVQKIN